MIDDTTENPNEGSQPDAEGEEQRRRSRRRGRRGKSRGASAPATEQQPEVVAPSAPPPPPPVYHQPEPTRPPEHLRPGRSVFRDGLDRQVCLARESLYAMEWPVNYRVGLAVRKLTEVGRNAESILLCDLGHPGPCVWPGYLGLEPAQMVYAPTAIEHHAVEDADDSYAKMLEAAEAFFDSPEETFEHEYAQD
ncbi:hypothetical protein BH09CHL1_BH09CHL1_14920 [soil metagenome]